MGVHYPLDVLAGAGLGMAAGGVIVLAAGTVIRRAGRTANSHNAATEVQAPEPRSPRALAASVTSGPGGAHATCTCPAWSARCTGS